MKKKILIASYSLGYGGIETSLVEFIKNTYKDFDITLVLQEKKGVYLNKIPKEVKIIEYRLNQSHNVVIRKIKNRTKLLSFIKAHKNKYDISICYSQYDIPSCLITQGVCEHSIVWVHTDYSNVYTRDEMKSFFNKRSYDKFSKYVFVSNEARDHTMPILDVNISKTGVVNNLLDIEGIKIKSQEFQAFPTKVDCQLLFVGRLEEDSKRISALLEIMKELDNTYQLTIVGDGEDRERYENRMKELELNNTVMIGSKTNPYPYIKEADIVLLPSKYEGFPVVCMEALLLDTSIITTIQVSSNDFKLTDYAHYVETVEEELYQAIIDKNNRTLKQKFNAEEYNKDNLDQIYKLLKV